MCMGISSIPQLSQRGSPSYPAGEGIPCQTPLLRPPVRTSGAPDYTLAPDRLQQPKLSIPQSTPSLPARPRGLVLQVRLDRGQGNQDVATPLDGLEPTLPDRPVHRKDMPHTQGRGSFRNIQQITGAHLTLVDVPAPDAFNRAARRRPRGIVPVERDPWPRGGWRPSAASPHADMYRGEYSAMQALKSWRPWGAPDSERSVTSGEPPPHIRPMSSE